MKSPRCAQLFFTLFVLAAHRAGAVDMSGPWHEHLVLVENPTYTEDQIVTFTQTATTLTSSDGYSGTIDPGAGVFSMTTPAQVCPGATLSGTVHPAGTTFMASSEVWVLLGPPRPGCYPVHFDISGTRCGNGVVDPGEACDDGNITGGDCCDSSCQQAAPDAQPCDDGIFCNGADSCVSGACATHPGDPCVGGAECADVCDEAGDQCARPAGTPCTDDGLGCTADACNGAGACVHPVIVGRSVGCPFCTACDANGQCVPSARTVPECQTPKDTRLDVRNAAFDTADLLKWNWTSAYDVLAAAFGDPTTVEDYALCIFDESGPGSLPLLQLDVPAGGTCGSRPCWRRVGNPPGAAGLVYKDPDATPHGVVSVLLKPGAASKGRIKLTGKGTNLPLRAAQVPFPLPLRVQLQALSGSCWEATYYSATVNDGERFKAAP